MGAAAGMAGQKGSTPTVQPGMTAQQAADLVAAGKAIVDALKLLSKKA